MNQPTSLLRRQCLRSASAFGLTAALGRWAQAGSSGDLVQAPPGNDYKALVCVFLFGGNDGNNMVVPLDARFADYSRGRGPALALPRESLLPLAIAADDGADAKADYGLHPAMAPLLPLWTRGRLALQFNTGALLEPLTRDAWLRAGARPDNLFSHSDQQEFAQGLQDGAAGGRSGWGFRLAGGPPADAARLPALISLAGNQRFLQGDVRSSLVLPARGNFGLSGNAADSATAARTEALRALWVQGDTRIGQQAGQILNAALNAASVVNPLINPPAASPATPAAVPFATLRSDISQQLLRVARLIEARGAIGNRRQVFFVALNGFDTHSNQRADQERLLGELAAALRAFHDATEALGVADQVTSFTLSDFARTFKPNNTGGSDHAWGNHHMVLGGAVRGGRSYGSFPTLAAGGPDDAGREGRWIPTTSFDQVAATLARWFGADADALARIAPHLGRFDQPDLGFMA
jgi:uncharacterized protein (DUF1501 family)